MGVLSEGNIRVSLPPGTPAEEVDRFLDALPAAVSEVRAHLAPAEPGPGLVVDALGKKCPIPVIELAKVFDQVPVGAVVTVLSDDEAASLDIPAWCAMRSQSYLGPRPAPRGTAYRVRRTS
jgi:cysteine desulfurase